MHDATVTTLPSARAARAPRMPGPARGADTARAGDRAEPSPSGDVEPAETFGVLAATLWSEREVLESLLFKLVEEQLVLAAGAGRWLGRADAELRGCVERLRASEVIRGADVDALVGRLGLPADTTLAGLARSAPEPWPALLLDHRDALRRLVAEIETVAGTNRRMLQADAEPSRAVLEQLAASVRSYDEATLQPAPRP